MAVEPRRDADYLRQKLVALERRIADLENASPLSVLAESTTNPAYAPIMPGMLVGTFANVPGEGILLPGGFLWLEGTFVSRVVYVRLWEAWGFPNTGDGSTTFTLHDTRDRAPFGAGAEILLQTAAGGGVLHVHTLPDHTHPIPATSHQGASNTTITGSGNRVVSMGGGTPGQDGDHNHSGSTNAGGSGTSGDSSANPIGNFGINWLVKT